LRRGTTPLHKPRKIALAALPLNISQRHESPRMVTPNVEGNRRAALTLAGK
jgi:hypothetical protein